MSAFDKFPTGQQFQMGVALGSIKKPIHLSQNNNKPETYYCAFILSTRTSEDKHTELHCYLEGDEAYAFANEMKQYDILQIFFEINHVWNWGSNSVKNRVHVLGWASFKELYGDFPLMKPDEEEFLMKMLELYRKQAPLPNENEVYVWKAIKNGWSKERRTKSTDPNEKKEIIEKK